MEMTPYISGEDDITSLDKSFVVKPVSHGSSIGVSIVRPGKGTLEEAMKEALKFDQNLFHLKNDYRPCLFHLLRSF